MIGPENCDLCGKPKPEPFVDGKTKDGPWAYMCLNCHKDSGIGFGTGHGQKYEKQADGSFKKVEG